MATATYNNLGNVYARQGNYPNVTVADRAQLLGQALKNTFAALKIQEGMGDKNGIINSYINIGNFYSAQQKFDEGYQYLSKALAFSKEIGSLEQVKSCYEGLAIADSGFAASSSISVQKRIEYAVQGMEHYKLFITYRDSVCNEGEHQKN